MAGEVCAFLDTSNVSYTVAKGMGSLLRSRVPISMFTDSKQVFDAMTKGKKDYRKAVNGIFLSWSAII